MDATEAAGQAAEGREIPEELRNLIIRFGVEDPRWGSKRVHGELRRLGHRVGISTIRRQARNLKEDPAKVTEPQPARGAVCTFGPSGRH